MFQAFFLSFGQLLDKPIARVFLKSLAVTVIVFIVSGLALWWAMRWAFRMVNGAPAGEAGTLWGWATGWAQAASAHQGLADLMSLVLFLLASWLLFRVIAVAVIGIFADEVVIAVEKKHYPDRLAVARDVPFWRGVWMGLGSAFRAIAINVVLSPIYLILLVTGVGTAVAFFVVNAWLLGRDLGDMVAARHMPKEKLPRWRSRTVIRRFLLGSIGTGLFLIPGLNLIAPVLGTAMATHMLHRKGIE
ncbi:EI24 domain-containing protein [Sphingosinithalassobacter portus]|uniref:EI24 domain-containing protein n=1 Tax=Stakelama portus TaxID=2676234 RepID=UPI000D6DE928|nr:EI24 domain-containing protein [Sphingosinithalassobacter portus]